jgi:hypothetical protein
MANPTTNYGFVLPTSSDLVTDLPADFDVALQGVDTRLKALNPSTTLGDIEYASATADTNTRLGIGTTGQVLTVSGGVPAWSAAPGANFSLLNSGGTALTGAQTVTVSGISGKNTLWIWVDQIDSASASSTFSLRLNTDTGSNYRSVGPKGLAGSANANYENNHTLTTGFAFAFQDQASANDPGTMGCYIFGANSSGPKMIDLKGYGTSTRSANYQYNIQGFYNSASTISSVSIFSSVGNLQTGRVYVYGSNV